nr:Alpha-ketoglutarate-dependent dioxygenase alkB -like protein 2 [Ipomoea batatas]
MAQSETLASDSSFASGNASRSASCTSHQPSDKVGKVLFGGQIADEEAHSMKKRKPCSGTNEKIYPKKLTTIHEVAKQRELSGTLESESNLKIKKQLSDAKCKELSGNEIFGPPSVAPPRSLIVARSMESKESKFIGESAPRNVCMSVKVSNPTRGQSNIMFGDEPVVKTIKKIHS